MRRIPLIALPALAMMSLMTVAAEKQESSAVASVAAAQSEAKAWLKAHEASLPKEFATFAPLPKLYRHYILARLSVAEQGHLWRAHISTFLQSPDNQTPEQRRLMRAFGRPLSAQQREFVREVLDSLDRIFDSTLTLTERQGVAKPLCDRAKTVFTREQAALVLGMVGSPDSDIGRKGAVGNANSMSLAGVGVEVLAPVRFVLKRIHKAPLLDCYCNQGSLCDCDPYSCTGQTLCLVPQDEFSCGCFHIWSCNGTCNYF
jgi:hypothetical protein